MVVVTEGLEVLHIDLGKDVVAGTGVTVRADDRADVVLLLRDEGRRGIELHPIGDRQRVRGLAVKAWRLLRFGSIAVGQRVDRVEDTAREVEACKVRRG